MDSKTVITIPYDHEWKALRWAVKYCPSYITNVLPSVDNIDHGIDYYFSEEKDAMFFALKWA